MFDRVRGLIGQHAGQATVLHRMLDRGIGAVGGEPRRNGDAGLISVLDKAPVRHPGGGAELDGIVRGDVGEASSVRHAS